ncbi:MAG: glycosyltransferase family 9 protein, partial [Planctomycetota bacterium]
MRADGSSWGGTVILETSGPLTGLLRGFPGIDELVEHGPNRDSTVAFDVFASLLDMPFIFGTTLETIPADVPYIHADPAKVEYWRTRVLGPGFKVGIVWAGSTVHGNDRYRSCKLQCFAPLMGIDNVCLYGLQKGNAAGQVKDFGGERSLTNFSDELHDFTDTAAVIENLDLVISVDTSVLHLAGAMGKATWALLPFAPEWRWMLSRPDSPWYPTMKLFRQ